MKTDALNACGHHSSGKHAGATSRQTQAEGRVFRASASAKLKQD